MTCNYKLSNQDTIVIVCITPHVMLTVITEIYSKHLVRVIPSRQIPHCRCYHLSTLSNASCPTLC